MDRFSRDGLTFRVADEGPAEGEAVVLLHGWPQDGSAFAEVVPLLHASGLRTLVPTQRGYTAEARPRDRRAYRTSETASDVLALLDAAGLPQAHVVGHDWGGAQAWALGAWHPERVSSLTVLSTPHPAAMAAALVSGGQALRSWYMGLFQVPVFPELLVGRTLRRTLAGSGLPAEHVDRYVRAMAEPGALTGSLNWYRGLPFSARPAVGRVGVPTTYVWGRHDFALGRPAAERTAAYVRGPYRFVELDAGHWLPEANPEEVAEAVLARIGR
jgi:pimeloyl-ACP methyl ester carboxylesterase